VKVEPLTGPVKLERSDECTVRWDRVFQSTTLHQFVTLAPNGAPVFGYTTEWKELGGPDKQEPFLKVAFDVRATDPKLTIQIPFGAIEKPTDNGEYGAREWADLAGNDGGVAILNDCKHGVSAEKNTLRLSLIRTSYYPDPRPNDRPQAARWVFQPHTGDYKSADLIRKSEAFNHPLWATVVKANANGPLALEQSLLSVNEDDVVITGVKKAEDDDGLIVRFYESQAKTAHATLKLPFEAQKVETVNFVEDKLADESAPSVDLRACEIRTLKVSGR